MKLIDTHCHLYVEEFASDIDEVIKRAQSAGVNKFYLPAIDSGVISAMMALQEQFPENCIAMMGLHPCSVKENYMEELQIVEDWLSRRAFAAVGEIGLDYYWDKSFVAEQVKAFETQLQWSVKYNLPVSVHTRDAVAEAIHIVSRYARLGARGIFHCFTGSYENAKEIIQAGFYLGIGGVLTFKNSGVAEVISKIDLRHLVLETDAPYLAPAPFRGKRNESSYLKYVVSRLAEIKKCTVEEVAAVTTANAEKIFAL